MVVQYKLIILVGIILLGQPRRKINFEYVTLCFINIGMICHFQSRCKAEIYISFLMDSTEVIYTYNYINVNMLHLVSKKNYSVENISVATVIKGV